jgi:hypothetical protein
MTIYIVTALDLMSSTFSQSDEHIGTFLTLKRRGTGER